MFLVEQLPRLPQYCERLGRQLESCDAHPDLGVTRIIRVVAAVVLRYQLLDLPQILSDSRVSPRRLGLGSRNPRQLANRRE
jgi:hypothetical protein